MRWKITTVALVAALATGNVAGSQTIAQIGGPAEAPPKGFKGDQFIDSRGCVFMRISSGAGTGWYPRVNKEHKVVCGMPPTFGPKPVIEMAEETAPTAPAKAAPVAVAAAKPVAAAPIALKPAAAKPAPAKPAPQVAAAKPATGKPVETVASRMMPPAAPAAPVLMPVAFAAQPAPYGTVAPASYQVVSSNGIPPGKIGCFRSAPVAEIVALRDGGTAVVCTRGDGTATGWRSPIFPNTVPAGAALRASGATPVTAAARPATARPAAATPQVYATQTYVVPKGYKRAWDDDRLNPLRGQGTAVGQAMQDQIWTRDVPARLIVDKAAPLAAKAPLYTSTKSAPAAKAAAAPKVTVSGMNGAGNAPKAAAERLWVQVGSFGIPANAQGAADRLAALGLSVGKSNLTQGGKALQIVFAGPFGDAASAQAALQKARRAGFGDAFLR